MSAVVVQVPALAGLAGATVALAGSRSLPFGGAAVIASAARSLVANGASVVVGCATGADQAVLQAGLPPQAVRVFAAFGPVSPPWRAARYTAPGAWSGSAVAAVAAALLAGSPVTWWAGGGQNVPLKARLAARTRAVIATASAGLVVCFGSPSSRGSLLAAQCAAARGLPVLAFPIGFPPHQLPSPSYGSWVSAGGSGIWSGAYLWVPSYAQGVLL